MSKDSKFSELDPETAEKLSSLLESQELRSFEAIISTDKWLTQQNFLVNAGGAAAVLSYMSSAQASDLTVVTLAIFVLGVVASGVEIRYLLKVHSELHEDALRRRSGFVSDRFSVSEAADVQAPRSFTRKVHNFSGMTSQGAFVLGCIVGLWGLLCS